MFTGRLKEYNIDGLRLSFLLCDLGNSEQRAALLMKVLENVANPPGQSSNEDLSAAVCAFAEIGVNTGDSAILGTVSATIRKQQVSLSEEQRASLMALNNDMLGQALSVSGADPAL